MTGANWGNLILPNSPDNNYVAVFSVEHLTIFQFARSSFTSTLPPEALKPPVGCTFKSLCEFIHVIPSKLAQHLYKYMSCLKLTITFDEAFSVNTLPLTENSKGNFLLAGINTIWSSDTLLSSPIVMTGFVSIKVADGVFIDAHQYTVQIMHLLHIL